ncbi:Peroxisomal membrane protein PAS20 [Actinomortierella wolfii]|nr:Peroxisomal membrane protein PAS20 [Actinomortierella wolfii]
MASPPKPWERAAGVSAASTTSAPLPVSSAPAPATSTSLTDSSAPPALPARNASMMGTSTTTSSAYRPGYGTYGSGYSSYSSGYGGYGGYGSTYSSPYNRMGYGSTYGGYGSYSSPYSRMGMYGSSYSGYGYGGYGMNRMGMGMNGINPMNPEEMSLMQRMEQGTAPTFQLIESVVGAFGGFAQMLESTFMATHSSFMAMVGVAEQFGHLRSYLGQILSVFALLRWAKSLVYRLLGKKMPVNTQELTPGNFQEFQARPRLSKRPIVIFLFAVVGLPYLMGRLIRALSRQPEQQQITAAGQVAAPVNPQNLDFARALYDFQPSSPQELGFRRGDIIAILSRQDPLGQESQWWRGRLRSGEMGLFPCNYVEIINKGGNNNNNPNANNSTAATTPSAAAAAAAPNATAGLPGAPVQGQPVKATSQAAADLQAALAGSAFEKFEF